MMTGCLLLWKAKFTQTYSWGWLCLSPDCRVGRLPGHQRVFHQLGNFSSITDFLGKCFSCFYVLPPNCYLISNNLSMTVASLYSAQGNLCLLCRVIVACMKWQWIAWNCRCRDWCLPKKSGVSLDVVVLLRANINTSLSFICQFACLS